MDGYGKKHRGVGVEIGRAPSSVVHGRSRTCGREEVGGGFTRGAAEAVGDRRLRVAGRALTRHREGGEEGCRMVGTCMEI